ncbi:MAG: rhodanese-like domain-containing protein [Spirosomataceae bacterium]
MSVKELQRRLASGEVLNLVDVRTPGEFEDFNIGGISLPMDDLLLRIDQLESLKNQEVILLCGVGLQSHIATKILAKKGFEQVEHLEGGLEAYLSL